jgi:very-short-patch-repair endonuclease
MRIRTAYDATRSRKIIALKPDRCRAALWYFLRGRRFLGLKFKRQKPLGNYIVDFVCLSPKLIVEVDGGQHSDQIDYDTCRDQWLSNEGYTVLRFWNNQILGDTTSVLEAIRETVLTLTRTLPNAEQH